MKRTVLAVSIFACAGIAACQGSVPQPIRIQIRHADPWAIKALLEGRNLTQPEIGTLSGVGAYNLAAAQAGAKALITGGRLVVNPTDNSLWWFPDRNSG